MCWGGAVTPCALVTVNHAPCEALCAELATLFKGLGLPGDR